ncbi:MAG: VanW family protein [Candidatus Moranbacteria bacterium]|nr:VanW family protein [Candidatus Moranbacteria bacterium]
MSPAIVFASDRSSSEDVLFVLEGGSDYSEPVVRQEASTWLTFSSRLFLGEPSYYSEIENYHACTFPGDDLCQFLLTSRLREHTMVETHLTVDRSRVSEYLQDTARFVHKEPVNATFEMRDGQLSVLSSSKDGVNLNISETADRIVTFLSESSSANFLASPGAVSMAIEIVAPTVDSHNISTLGITDVVGEGRSNFSGSSSDRIYNIKTAASRFHGQLLAPGEELSFVDLLGPVDGDHGYKEELVIRNNRTEPEFGGGICQVSTTLFRAAIFSGLEITARRNHSYPVKYYAPVGFDATIYVPRPDLRFVNNTPGHILIQLAVEGTELIVRFYGTSDGRSVAMDGPHITDRGDDGSLKTTFTQTVTSADGTVREDIFRSYYRSPDLYPKPEDVAKLTEKPKGWSDREWQEYKRGNGL